MMKLLYERCRMVCPKYSYSILLALTLFNIALQGRFDAPNCFRHVMVLLPSESN